MEHILRPAALFFSLSQLMCLWAWNRWQRETQRQPFNFLPHSRNNFQCLALPKNGGPDCPKCVLLKPCWGVLKHVFAYLQLLCHPECKRREHKGPGDAIPEPLIQEAAIAKTGASKAGSITWSTHTGTTSDCNLLKAPELQQIL